MRIIFAGTPQVAVPTLEALIDSSHEVCAVITRPPARKGRGRTLHPSEVALCAASANIPVIEASTMKDEETKRRIRELGADLGIVVAYGALIPQDVLNMPTHGWVNVHFSDLPRWRGAAPVQWAILTGDEVTASCVFQLEEGLDTGPIFSRLPVVIEHETSGELLERMAVLGARQAVQVATDIAAGVAHAQPQIIPAGGVVLAPRLSSADGFISCAQSATEADRRIRAVSPNPGAYALMTDGRRLKLGTAQAVDTVEGVSGECVPGRLIVSKHDVHVCCLTGFLRLGKVAPEGKGWMDAAAWTRGARLTDEVRFELTLKEN